ncbi:MAG: gamma-glutamylcyclotransferase family protein [Myxococcota bacterium]
MLVFLYGTSLPGQPDHVWVAGLPAARATVRGSLWRSRRNRPALVPDPEGRAIRGVVIDVDDARLAVLDTLERAGGGELARRLVRVSQNLRSAGAEAWVLTAAEARAHGYRPIKGDEWTGR